MSEHIVSIVGAEDVYPPKAFDSLPDAFHYAFRVAKNWEGVGGAPEIAIKGKHSLTWSVDDIIAAELLRRHVEGV